MPKITVVYDPKNRDSEGKTIDVDEDTARERIREGRAVLATAKAEPKPPKS